MLGEAMEREIRSQPVSLVANASDYEAAARMAVGGIDCETIVLAARGSSDHAALYGRYLFEIHLGIPVVLAAPSVLTRYGVRVRYPKSLVIGVSQSGAAPDVSEVVESLRQDGHRTLAITNTPNSRLSNSAEATIQMNCGAEQSVAATTTYTSTLLILYQVARVMGAQLPSPVAMLPDERWIEKCRQEAMSGSAAILRSQVVFALGRGYGFCTAFESALKLMECALVACKAYSIADFQHGPKALAGHGSAAIVFGDRLPFLEEQGCLPIVAPEPSEHVHDALHPLWQVMFGQWLALHVARAKGLDPDDPRFIEKVTRTL